MGGYKPHDPTVYVVAWDDIHVVKVGFSAKQRWRKFELLGARLVALYSFESSHDAFELEDAGHAWLQANGAGYAFESAAAAAPYLGPDGGGYLECFRLGSDLLEHMLKHMLKHASEHGAKHCLEASQAMHATNATYATDERTQDSVGKPRVLDAAGPVDKSDSLRVVVACINWNHPSPVPHAMSYVLRDGQMVADWYHDTWTDAMEYAVPLARRLAEVAA